MKLTFALRSLALLLTTGMLLAPTGSAQSGKKKYRVTAYWKILDANDGMLDNRLECFGEVRANGELQWQITASDAEKFKRKKDETVNVTFGFGKSKKTSFEVEMYDNGMVRWTGFLKDRNTHKPDELLCEYDLPLSPQIAAGLGDRVITPRTAPVKAEFHYQMVEVK